MRTAVSHSNSFLFLFKPSLIVLLTCLSGTLAFAQKDNRPKSIRAVDFRNRTYQMPGENIRLRNGRYQNKGTVYSFESQKYKDFDGDKIDEVIVTLQKKTTGLVGRYKIYLVYSYKNNNLKLVFGQIRPRGDSVIIQQNNLVLSGFYWDKNDDDCCPSRKETEVYKWDKKRKKFIRTSKKSKKV